MKNYLKTILLLGILSIFLLVIGQFFGGQEGLRMAFFFSLLMNGIAYFFSDQIALATSGAKPLSQKKAPALYSVVSRLTKKAGIPMPKLYLIPTSQANAFATGRDPSHASVVVTQGLLENLPPKQIEAVIAHELSHVKNRDILLASVAAVLASAITFLARSGGGYWGQREDRENRSGLAMILVFLAPIAALLIQLAISRQREFTADSGAAKLMGSGEPLAEALATIHHSTRRDPRRQINPAFSSLYIANPIGGLGGTLMSLFSTHPPVEERIRRLK